MAEPTDGLTYKASGVDYDAMDPFKQSCQLAARRTAGNLTAHGYEEVEWTRGESAYLMHHLETGSYLGHVEEGLGTKNLVTDLMGMDHGDWGHYWHAAQDTVAMIVNDLVTLGALPLSLAMHLAVGESSWFDNQVRSQSLVQGWEDACNKAGAVWAGGETPTLKDIIIPGTAEINGSAIGIIQPGRQVINPANIRDGDAIVMFASSGIHANGLTVARAIIEQYGFKKKVSGGDWFGGELLKPTTIYVQLMRDLLKKVNIHYAVNITGHGWRKLMRATQPFVYRIQAPGKPQPVFAFIKDHAGVDIAEMYGNYNMGAGFAVYVDPQDVDDVILAGSIANIFTWHAGNVYNEGGRKAVEIEPLGITFEAESMNLR